MDLKTFYEDVISQALEKEDKGEEDVEWETTGSEYLGQRVKRVFTVKGKLMHTCGVIDGWLPAAINDGLALWHVKHDDGDEEDLELEEVLESIKDWEESDEKPVVFSSWGPYTQVSGTAAGTAVPGITTRRAPSTTKKPPATPKKEAVSQ